MGADVEIIPHVPPVNPLSVTICCDCGCDLINGHRCKPCQIERDEYYREKVRADNSPVDRQSYVNEHSTYWGKP